MVAVTGGTAPEFSWSPDCGVHNLVVLEGVGPHSFGQYSGTWEIESQPDPQGLPTNRLRSTIQYGDIPPSARQLVAPVALIHGQPYTVYLNVYTLDQRTLTVGSRTFTP
jgi:hypothetical protein